MDQTSIQLRVIHPLAVDKTRVSTYGMAPVGESAAARAHRLRQYEDFFNAGGVGTPDDLAAFEACPEGISRPLGALATRLGARLMQGADAETQALGIPPPTSIPDFHDDR